MKVLLTGRMLAPTVEERLLKGKIKQEREKRPEEGGAQGRDISGSPAGGSLEEASEAPRPLPTSGRRKKKRFLQNSAH